MVTWGFYIPLCAVLDKECCGGPWLFSVSSIHSSFL